METLRQGLAEAPLGLGASETIRMHRFMQATPNLNTSRHDAYPAYYSVETQAFVAEMDRSVIAAYGYSFGDEA